MNLILAIAAFAVGSGRYLYPLCLMPVFVSPPIHQILYRLTPFVFV